MSHIKGRFGIDVLFTDSTVAGGAKSLKTITLQHATEYDFGKVAVVTGTAGTAVSTVSVAPTTYQNAAGDAVSFASVSRVAFQADGPNMVACDGSGGCGIDDWTIYSRAGQVAVSEALETSAFSINVVGTAGTANYTLVMYGS
jgi:microcompartment protein CcmK/EutM